MGGKTRHPSELFFLVGLLVPLFWSIQGKTCSIQNECMPVADCHLIPWTCNGSDYVAATPGPTVDPSTQRCCIHLDTCGGELEVAGWINVRNTTVTVDGSVYQAEWLDTFITTGNATEPAIIKSAYVGSWNTLRDGVVSYPSQMFVAEPSNSCTVDGVAMFPEWYQVTANVLTSVSDDTLDVEAYRDKDCLCDADWDCLDTVCHVATTGMSSNKANLSQPNMDIQVLVQDYCQSVLTITNYTASSYFALGFAPAAAELDSFNYSASVEGGWGPDLDDDNPWFEILLGEDTMVSGIETQGMVTNPERRVDQFTVEYEASDVGAQTVGPDKVFVAGARLDTKTLNSFPTPVKANRIRLLIQKPCDTYYVGLRVGLMGCPHCSTSGECTAMAHGVCETQNFCSYDVPTTTLAPTTAPRTTTGMPTTPRQTTAQATATEATTPGDSTGTTQPNTGPLTTKPSTDTISNSPVPTTSGAPTTASSGTSARLQTVTPPQTAIQDKIAEFTQLTTAETNDLTNVLTDPGTDVSHVTVTDDFILIGLEVIQNISLDANSTKDQELQTKIINGARLFFEIVSDSPLLASQENGGELFESFLDTASVVVEVVPEQEDATESLLGMVSSIEAATVNVASTVQTELLIKEENIEGVISPYVPDATDNTGFEFDLGTDESADASKVTISSDALNDLNLPENTSLTIVVLKIDVPLNYPANSSSQRLSSSIISISVVGGDIDFSVPVDFSLEHVKKFPNETQQCNFWVEKTPETVGKWSTEGCITIAISDTETECKCTHLTNYAVLMWLGPEPMEENSTLETITTVGCLVSIIALIVALGLLLYLKSSLSSERIIIHMHLMGVTLVALVIFLAGSDKTESKPLCQFITIALHFFYMSMFSWMLVEGIHLYRQIVSVFDTGKSRLWIYLVIGWGIPVIVVGVSTGINFDKYGTHQLCWLDVKDGSLWAFIGPMIPICCANLVVLCMVCRIVVSAAKMQAEKPGFNSAKAGVRSSLLLLPILGVTWIFGYFAALSPVMMYTFVALNSFQGFFMALFHCFMSSEVNTALKQKIRKVKDSSIGGSSSVDSLHPNCFMNAEKAPLYEVITPLDLSVDKPFDLNE